MSKIYYTINTLVCLTCKSKTSKYQMELNKQNIFLVSFGNSEGLQNFLDFSGHFLLISSSMLKRVWPFDNTVVAFHASIKNACQCLTGTLSGDKLVYYTIFNHNGIIIIYA